MGTFSVQLQVGDPSGQRFEAIEAMVDSGATYLGIDPVNRRLIPVDALLLHSLARSGQAVQRPIGAYG